MRFVQKSSRIWSTPNFLLFNIKGCINPFRTAVPFREQTTQIISSLSPNGTAILKGLVGAVACRLVLSPMRVLRASFGYNVWVVRAISSCGRAALERQNLQQYCITTTCTYAFPAALLHCCCCERHHGLENHIEFSSTRCLLLALHLPLTPMACWQILCISVS